MLAGINLTCSVMDEELEEIRPYLDWGRSVGPSGQNP